MSDRTIIFIDYDDNQHVEVVDVDVLFVGGSSDDTLGSIKPNKPIKKLVFPNDQYSRGRFVSWLNLNDIDIEEVEICINFHVLICEKDDINIFAKKGGTCITTNKKTFIKNFDHINKKFKEITLSYV